MLRCRLLLFGEVCRRTPSLFVLNRSASDLIRVAWSLIVLAECLSSLSRVTLALSRLNIIWVTIPLVRLDGVGLTVLNSVWMVLSLNVGLRGGAATIVLW